jgi:hypothetical protein
LLEGNYPLRVSASCNGYVSNSIDFNLIRSEATASVVAEYGSNTGANGVYGTPGISQEYHVSSTGSNVIEGVEMTATSLKLGEALVSNFDPSTSTLTFS